MKQTGWLYISICISLMALASTVVSAQDRELVTKERGLFKEVCWVDVNDTAIRNGQSTTYYKGKVIEQGRYLKNSRVGRWRFYNLESILDYEYDFDRNELVMMSGQDRHELKMKTPCLFMGSPLIPYLFLVNNLSYPRSAVNESVEGRVVLALRVDETGHVIGFYIAERLHPTIDRAVVEVAKTMPDKWRFIAATNMGHPVASEYHIAIEFQLE
ncbi:TonB family protein [Carboxylicivirga mesophila]|uniref:TonB family protein n=1 Tax=Carboxylicivirga mesophila TaxID=1166478 RepID=A0ABS5KFF8_9BACT|nr:TonB family protein [Carboxylicivirga mesophila]